MIETQMNAAAVILTSLLTSVVVSAGTVYAIERLELIPQKAAPEPMKIPAPPLRGLSEGDARANLTASGLVLLIRGREPSAEVEAGHVLDQMPPAGAPLAKGDTITVTVAEALPRVPTLTGLTADAAAAVLVQAGYRLKMGDGVVDDKVPEGKIVSQTPAADTPLRKDSVVTIQVALSPKPIDVPPMVGMSLNGAKQKLQEIGLKPGKISWLQIPDKQAFIVMQQDPPAGKKLKPGEEVNLFVNQ